MQSKLKYADITEKIIGCAMQVHQKMKNGYVEPVYQKCLAIEMKKAGLDFVQEADMAIYYDNIIVGRRRVDFLVKEKISVEIKAVAELTDTHLAQAINYLETNNLETGLLINFGAKSLQFKRIINNKQSINPNSNPANLRL